MVALGTFSAYLAYSQEPCAVKAALPSINSWPASWPPVARSLGSVRLLLTHRSYRFLKFSIYSPVRVAGHSVHGSSFCS